MLDAIKNFFIKAWQGKLSLPMAFFVLYFLPPLFITLTIQDVIYLLYPEYYSFNNPEIYAGHSLTLSSKLSSILLPYTIFTVICVWRCARNSTLMRRIISRLVVVIGLVVSMIHFIVLIGHFDLLNIDNNRRMVITENICKPGPLNDLLKTYNFPASGSKCMVEANKVVSLCSNQDVSLKACIVEKMKTYAGGEQALIDREMVMNAYVIQAIHEKKPALSAAAIIKCGEIGDKNEMLQCIGISRDNFKESSVLAIAHLVLAQCVASKMDISLKNYADCSFEKNPAGCYKKLGYTVGVVEKLTASCVKEASV